jgi:hypothetical protein
MAMPSSFVIEAIYDDGASVNDHGEGHKIAVLES